MSNEAAALSGTEPVQDRSHAKKAVNAQIAKPAAADAPEVHALIAACPPLDTNSLYATLIQCTHFAGCCAVARIDGKVAGWISGHRPPSDDETYFLWQIGVHPDARGKGLARQMLANILARPAQTGVRRIQTSITRANEASWAVFRNVSAWLDAPMHEELWFDQARHFGGQNASEFLVTIGPFSMPENPV